MLRCFVLLLHAYLAASASVFASLPDEASAKTLAETVDLKLLASSDLTLLIKDRRWLSAAHTLLSRAQKMQGVDFSAPVRSAVSSVRKELDDLIRSLDKNYGEASQVSPAFQWAQNSSHVFLQVKFAQRWNAPGALELQNSSVKVSDCCFSFKGFGEHSMIVKEYKLFLQFLDPVSEEGSSWHFAAAGRLSVTVKKVRARKWERLLRSENTAPENMGIWRDMQDKWKAELTSKGKDKPKQKSGDDDDDDSDDEDAVKKCPPGSFHDSKVTEFCPETFLASTRPLIWSVLFYSSNSASPKFKGLTPVWRALADIVPSHNKDAAVGAVDCSRHQKLCDEHGAKQSSLPAVLRYQPGSSEGDGAKAVQAGTLYTGDLSLEDLAAWAAAGSEKMEKKPKKSKKKSEAKKEL